MSLTIQRLPGETVESLRSTVVITSYADAVHELLYNALDAGARSIDCVIALDTEQLTVADNGRGMAKDVLDRLGTRYLTSQRSHPRTHGYRGEALASVAHLSELSIVSTTSDSLVTHRLRLSHTGKRESHATPAAIASPNGTVVTIKNLFVNIPARRGLSTSALTACRNVFQVAALSSPATSMTLWHQEAQGKKLKKCSTRGSSDALAAFKKLFGDDLVINVERINARSHEAAVSGFISLTGSVSSRWQYLFINGHHSLMPDAKDAIARKFKQSNFSLVLGRAYQYPKSHTSYKTEIQPVYVLDISTRGDVDDGSVEIIALVNAVCDRFLAKHHFAHGVARTDDLDSASGQIVKQTQSALPTIPTAALFPLPQSASEKQKQVVMNRKHWLKDALSSLRTPDIIPLCQPDDQAVLQPRILGNSLKTPGLKIHIGREALRQAIVIGQVSDKFIACLVNLGSDSKPTIVLVDQHAASERVRIERILRELCLAFLAGTINTQAPSSAVSIRLSPLQDELYQQPACAALLARWGIEISPTSTDSVTYSVDRIPKAFAAKLGDKDGHELSVILRDFFEDCAYRNAKAVLEDISNGRFSQAQAQVMMPKEMVELANSAACRGAIMFGDCLSSAQCARLIVELGQAQFPFICAHGRPSMAPIMAVDVPKLKQRIDWTL